MITADDIRNARILIVDDKQANVRLLERGLRSGGYANITSTMDPNAVCPLHRENKYDLILLDMEMPGLHGFQVIGGIKEIERDGNLPILVVTAEPSHKLRALKVGVRDFINKPFDLVEVLACVQNMVEARLLYLESRQYTQKLERLLKEMEDKRDLGASS